MDRPLLNPCELSGVTIERVQQDEVRAKQLLAGGVAGPPLRPVNLRSRDVRDGDEEVDLDGDKSNWRREYPLVFFIGKCLKKPSFNS